MSNPNFPSQTLAERTDQLCEDRYGEGQINRIDQPLEWLNVYADAVAEYKTYLDGKIAAQDNGIATINTHLGAINGVLHLW